MTRAYVKRAQEALAEAQKAFDQAHPREEFDDVAVLARADLARALEDLERMAKALAKAKVDLALSWDGSHEEACLANVTAFKTIHEALAPRRAKRSGR